jgi:hypothetical protein
MRESCPEKGLGKSVRGFIMTVSRHFPRGAEKNHQIPIRLAGIPAEIRIRHSSDKSGALPLR